MRRTAAVIAAVGLLASVVTGCSGSEEKYCETVKSVGKSKLMSELDYGDKKAVDEAESRVEEIVNAAPEEIREDWSQIQKGIRVSGKLIQGASQDDDKVRSGMQTLERMSKSSSAVSKDVKERCNYEISPF